MLKRIFDIIVSILVLIVLFPLFLFIALLIKLDSPGPVFYRGKRIGKNGNIFKIFKFRTMIRNAEEIGGPSTPDDDPRITKIGRVLRRYKLDELPQLFNVIKGEMSLVGPRPEVEIYVDMMTEEERKVILSVLPGMTDFASLWNFQEGEILKGSLDPEKTYIEKIRPKKIKLQIEYIKNQSMWTDIKIIFQTLIKILSLITKIK